MGAMAEIPKNMKAVTVCEWPKSQRIFNLLRSFSIAAVGDGVASVQEVPLPKLADGQILVRVKAVALNPTDWKHLDFLAPSRARLGCDYCGEIVQLSKSNKRGFSIGDRVGGSMHGGLYQDKGSFAEYVAIGEDVTWKLPENLSDAEAAAMGVSMLTAMQGLNIYLGLPWINDEKAKAKSKDTPIFIYSGATTSGLMSIQLAKLAGYQPIVTCSPHSTDLVKRYGAVACFDYRSPTSVEEIRKAYPNITKAIDCYSEGSSFEFCGRVLTGNGGGEVVTLLPGKAKFSDVKTTNILAYTLMGESFQYFSPIGPRFAAIPEHRTAAARFAELVPPYLEDGTIKPLPFEKAKGGIETIVESLDRLRKQQVSGKKLVVELE